MFNLLNLVKLFSRKEKVIDLNSVFLKNLIDVSLDKNNCPNDYNYTTNIKQKHIILVSGGLDSTVVYLKMKQIYDIECIYFDIGQSYKEKEIQALEKMNINYKVIKLNNIEVDKSWNYIIPLRNILFFLEVKKLYPDYFVNIYFGINNGEGGFDDGDKSLTSIQMLNLLGYIYGFYIHTPLMYETKSELVNWAKNNGYIDIVRNTVSCFNTSKTGRCGRCQSCLRTYIAFKNNDIELDFDINPLIGATKYVNKYKKIIKNGANEHYSRKRINELKSIL